MTGTGLSIITQDSVQSYNKAVNTINQHQRRNVQLLNKALENANSTNIQIETSYAVLASEMAKLKENVFINQTLCDNWGICNVLTCGNSNAGSYGGLSVPIERIAYRMEILD